MFFFFFFALHLALIRSTSPFKCLGIPHNITISRNRVCDGKMDCPGPLWSDERNCTDSRFYFCPGENDYVRFPDVTSQSGDGDAFFCDGFSDCGDGSDERSDGFGFKCVIKDRVASVGKSDARCVIPQRYIHDEQRKVPLCADASDLCLTSTSLDPRKCWPCLDGVTIVRREQFCDGTIDCPDLSDECLCEGASDVTKAVCARLLRNSTRTSVGMATLIEGLCNRTNHVEICPWARDEGQKFECPSNRRNKAHACDGRPECKDAEDECGPQCASKGQVAPFCSLIVAPFNHLNLTGCDPTLDKWRLCEGAVDCGGAADEDPSICPHRKPCDVNNASAGSYDVIKDRCNHELSCSNKADEMNCNQSTHVYCDNNLTFLYPSQVGDGVFDCQDYSDECGDMSGKMSSPTNLIREPGVAVWLWVMCLASLCGNSVVFVKTIFDLRRTMSQQRSSTHNRILVCNKMMVLNLAVADFLMGIYLFGIGVRYSTFSGKYCEHKTDWLSGKECEALGVISILSSQASVLIMTAMTSYRLYGIFRPFQVRTVQCRYVALIMTAIWALASVVACIPAINSDYFTVSYVLDQPYISSTIISVAEVNDLVRRASLYLPKNVGLKNPATPTFDSILPLVAKNREVFAKHLGYFSTDGVCLPRLYGKLSDPGSGFTLLLMMADLTAFIYMILAYIFIYCEASLSSTRSPGQNSESLKVDTRSKEDAAMWGRIVRLILTNMLCWIPVCIASFVSLGGASVSADFYAVTAALLIPLNSALNPWLYSSVLINFLTRVGRKIWGILRPHERVKLRQETSKNSTSCSCTPLHTQNLELIAVKNIQPLDGAPEAETHPSDSVATFLSGV